MRKADREGLLLNLAEGYSILFDGFTEVGDAAEGFTEITLLKKSLKSLGDLGLRRF